MILFVLISIAPQVPIDDSRLATLLHKGLATTEQFYNFLIGILQCIVAYTNKNAGDKQTTREEVDKKLSEHLLYMGIVERGMEGLLGS